MKKIWDAYSIRFGRTIFHPQFIMRTFTHQSIEQALRVVKGKLLDIGCGRMEYRAELLQRVSSYTGFDHPTVSKLYHSKPDVLGDATDLPFPNASFDSVLLLQVLEYIDEPKQAIQEASRVLKKDGFLIVSVPFLYPLHDVPHDRLRYSKSYLKDLLSNNHLRVVTLKEQGNSLLVLLQIGMLALFRFVHNALRDRNPFSLIAVPVVLLLSAICIPVGNLLAFFVMMLTRQRKDEEFVLNYTIVAKKTASA